MITKLPVAGTDAPELPPEVVAQVDVELQAPLLTEYR